MISTWGWRFIRRILNRLRSDEGWLTVFAVLAAVIILAGSLEEARWLRRLPSLYVCAVLAAGTGMIVARLVRTTWLAALLLTASGLIFSVLTAARAWPSFLLITSNLRYAFFAVTQPDQPLPIIIALPAWMLERFSRFFEAIGIWQQSIAGGQAGSAPQVISLTLLLIVWVVSVWAGWATFRYQRPLLALLPAGFVLAINIYFASSEAIWLAPFMVALVVLAVRLRQYHLEKKWEDSNTDYSPEYRLELYLSGVLVAATVAGIMFLMPSLRLSVVSGAFWDVFGTPYDALEERVERYLPDLDRAPRSLADLGMSGGGGLPRSHLIGDSPDLSERLVMVVSTSDADPISSGAYVNYRWRGVNFSDYDGRGWANPADLSKERFSPGEMWTTQSEQDRRSIRQVFEITTGQAFWLYGLAEPIASDRAFQVHLRGSDDAVGFEANARDYTLISQVPNATESDLRAASPPDADAFALYLDIPESTPERVTELARSVTLEAEMPYDQARALEAFLRTYPYDLDVPEPPPDADVADYFLFDLQKGYCDYYATSMVVMARSLGLPARLAVGYAAGEYDAERQHFSVVEADAHSWPEIYFSDYGWIPFEPTASQPVFVYQPLATPTEIVEQESIDLAEQLAQLQRQSWLLYGAWRWALPLFVLIVLILALRLMWRDWRLRRQAANPWQLAWLRLESWGNCLDVPPAPWLTPREYAHRWRTQLDRTDDFSASAQAATKEIDQLSEALEQRAYAPASTRPDDSAAGPQWRRLRSNLRRQLWERRFRGIVDIKD